MQQLHISVLRGMHPSRGCPVPPAVARTRTHTPHAPHPTSRQVPPHAVPVWLEAGIQLRADVGQLMKCASGCDGKGGPLHQPVRLARWLRLWLWRQDLGGGKCGIQGTRAAAALLATAAVTPVTVAVAMVTTVAAAASW